METLPVNTQNKTKMENRGRKLANAFTIARLWFLLSAILYPLSSQLPARAQEVVPGYTNRLVFTTTNGSAYFQSRLVWTTNAIAIPSNTIPWATNTTWGYGGGLMTWGVTGGTNYLFNSIGPNLWGRVAISTNF